MKSLNKLPTLPSTTLLQLLTTCRTSSSMTQHTLRYLTRSSRSSKVSKAKCHEFERLLINHFRPHQNRITEEDKVPYFQSLLRDEAIDFWQTLRITPETTFKDVVEKYRKEIANDDFEEISKKFKWDQLVMTPRKKILKRPKVLKEDGYTSIWWLTRRIHGNVLFEKLQIQHQLSTAGKSEVSVKEIKAFIQRRLEFQLLISQATAHTQFNEMSINTQKQPRQGYNTEQRNTDKPKINGDCHYCGKRRHRERECCSKERDQA